MKTIIITEARLKKELRYLLASVSLAFALNIVSIVAYKTAWRELYTQLPVVILLGIIIYYSTSLVRFLYSKMKFTFRKGAKKQPIS